MSTDEPIICQSSSCLRTCFYGVFAPPMPSSSRSIIVLNESSCYFNTHKMTPSSQKIASNAMSKARAEAVYMSAVQKMLDAKKQGSTALAVIQKMDDKAFSLLLGRPADLCTTFDDLYHARLQFDVPCETGTDEIHPL